MSYILEALRKAERERRATRVPSLEAAHGGPEVASARPWPWPWVIGGLLLVLGAISVYVAWTPGSVAPPAPAVALKPAPREVPAPAARPAPPAPPPPAPVVAPARSPEPAISPPPVPSAAPPPARVEPARPRPSAARASTPAGPRPAEAPRAPAVARTPSEPRKAQDVPAAPLASPPPSPLVGVGTTEPRTPVAPVVPGTSPAPRPTTEPAPATGVPVATVPPAVVPPAVVPPAVPAAPAQARLALDVLVYSEVPAERLVFINGRKYVEGQAVDGETVIEEITPEGAVLRRGDQQRVTLRPRLNPYARPGSP